jgi:hypothetical protein
LQEFKNMSALSIASALAAASTDLDVVFTWDGTESSASQTPVGQISSTASTAAVDGTVQSINMGAGSTESTLDSAQSGKVPPGSSQQIFI